MIVWLASYPRSGNTFFRVILNSIFGIKTYSIYDDRGDIGADEKTSEVVGHEFLPQGFDIEKAREEEKVYYIKTHELLDNRVHKSDKVIYLIRDGRESTLSFAKHQNTFANQNKKIIDIIYGNTFIGSWSEHVASWDPKNRENTLLIKFEELTKEPIKFIKILSEFLEVRPKGDKIPSFEELKKINPKFFRSGKTNSWEDEYTQEEHLAFWLKSKKQMDEYGYEYKKFSFNGSDDSLLILESIQQNNYLINLILNQDKKFLLTNSNLVKLNKEIEQKQNIINQKNQAIQQKQDIINQKNQEIQQKQDIINQKNQELNQKKDIINQKNQEIQQKQDIINQKNQELNQNLKELTQKQQILDEQQQLIQQKSRKLDLLMESLKQLVNTSTKKHTIKKIKAYKQLMQTYHKVKK